MESTPREREKEDSSGNERSDPAHSSSLPQELIDLIIDTISDNRQQVLIKTRNLALTTLCACALVAHAWKERAQRHIFESAEIRGTTQLYSFAEVLRGSPALASVVQRLTFIRGSLDLFNSVLLYLPDCAESLFPTVLAGLLPNLRSLAFDELRSLSRAPPRGTHRLQSFVPIHHRFPLLLSSSGFSDIRELRLASIIFRTFNDFARMLHAFTRLQVLYCGDVDWITLGVILPPFMTPTGATQRNGGFLPMLTKLTIRTVGRYGGERLLAGLAVTGSLRTLTLSRSNFVKLSLWNFSVDPATGMLDGPDLSLFPRLAHLTILDIIPQSFRPAQHASLAALHELLASWSDDASFRTLTLGIKPAPTEGDRFYTKQNYMSFLGELGKSVEEACTHGRDSSIPALHARLEIPQDATASLEELEREACPCFPIALKAGKIRVEAHISESDDCSWKTAKPRRVPVQKLYLRRPFILASDTREYTGWRTFADGR